VFGLPGNPVSTLVCLNTLRSLPALCGSLGQNLQPVERIALGAPVTVTPPLTYFLPVRLEQDDWGRTWAAPAPPPTAPETSPRSPGPVASSSCHRGPNTYAKGFVTRVYRWS